MQQETSQYRCPKCKEPLRPELDPNLQKVFAGKCVKCEWPFTVSVTLEELGQAYVARETGTAKAAAAAAVVAKAPKRVEFYYSSAQKPGETFPCNNARALELVKKLQAEGVEAKAIDVAHIKDRFPIYHKAVSGPDATVRPVFGFKGALVDDFGTTVPALLIFEGDRYPSLAFPRTDPKGGLIRVEQALEELVTEAAQAKTGVQVA